MFPPVPTLGQVPFPSVDDFKEQFDRDFRYSVPAFGAVLEAVVTAGSITAINILNGGQGFRTVPTLTITDATGVGASATVVISSSNPNAGQITGIINLAGGTGYSNPVLTLTGGAGDDTTKRYVRDKDIQRAQTAAFNSFPCDTFETSQIPYAFNLLSAHFLLLNIQASSQGLRGQGEWLVNSKSVGDLTASYTIPDKIAQSPFLSPMTKTPYGLQYLGILAQYLVGNFASVPGMTKP